MKKLSFRKVCILHDFDFTINTVNKINKIKKAKYISTYDFNSLYTKLPNNKLLNALFQLIEFDFQGGNKAFM